MRRAGVDGAVPRILPSALALLLSAGCEESLPPRNDPENFLEFGLRGESGTVVISQDFLVISDFPGGLVITVRNRYDEVLQGEEAISIDIDLWVTGNEGTLTTFHGDRNNLLTPWMLQDQDYLTIEPESTAVFLVQWNHTGLQWWNYSGLTLRILPGFPADTWWFESAPLTLSVRGTLRMFADRPPVTVEGADFVVDYFLMVGTPTVTPVDSLQARFDQGLERAVLTWQTPFEINNAGFAVERSADDTTFEQLRVVDGAGTVFDTTYYSFTEPLALPPGRWYYRLQQWYDFGFIPWPIRSTASAAVVVP